MRYELEYEQDRNIVRRELEAATVEDAVKIATKVAKVQAAQEGGGGGVYYLYEDHSTCLYGVKYVPVGTIGIHFSQVDYTPASAEEKEAA